MTGAKNKNLPAESIYRSMVLIWASLLFSQVLLLAVAFIAKPELARFDFSKPLLGENQTLTLVFFLIALANVAVSFVIKKFLINRAINEQNPELVQTAIIVACALAETASLLGLVLTFISGYQYFFVFFILGIAGMILHFPLRQNFNDASYKNLTGRQF